MTVTFSTPPPGRLGKQSKYAAVYEACRARPGEWAEFPGPRQAPMKCNRGFEFIQRGPRRCPKVWVRYVGEDE